MNRKVKIMTVKEEQEFFKACRTKDHILNDYFNELKKEAGNNPIKLATIVILEIQKIEWLLINLLQELAINPYASCLGFQEPKTKNTKEYYEMTLGQLKDELKLFSCKPLQLFSSKIEELNKIRIRLVHKLFFPGKLSSFILDIVNGNEVISEVYIQWVIVEDFLNINFSFRIFENKLPNLKIQK